jgi:DMSO/TMAO reductase YedYZ molybdopterin-dependent catalytic subunit
MKARYKTLLAVSILLALLTVLAVSCHTSSEPVTVDLQSLKNSNPATVDNSDLPVSSIEELHTTAPPPDIDMQQYRLVVDGLVEHPLSLTYSEILSGPSVTKVVLLICPGVFVDNAEWTGIPVSFLLQEAGVKPQAKEVAFYSVDGYSKTLSLEKAQTDGVFLAHHVNGELLPLEHGHPLRLVAEGEYGYSWVKWVNRIEVLD